MKKKTSMKEVSSASNIQAPDSPQEIGVKRKLSVRELMAKLRANRECREIEEPVDVHIEADEAEAGEESAQPYDHDEEQVIEDEDADDGEHNFTEDAPCPTKLIQQATWMMTTIQKPG
ncbi:hypothetical protein ACFQT4_08225 [Pseudoduganella danionis]|uniref:hypothetical protein n=1 Tax=Pseudoduganella danionis TaxID=1890295 RepID=UPI0036094804